MIETADKQCLERLGLFHEVVSAFQGTRAYHMMWSGPCFSIGAEW